MDQRVSFITLAVSDLERSRAFYLDGLGWRAFVDVPGEVLMIRVGEHLALSLWDERGFEAEIGPIRRGDGVVPVSLAHNVGTEAEVDAILETASRLGADTTPATRRDWGGYTGYLADPDGIRWEIAVNPAPDFAFLVP
jgi:catechol 2,3-dioxygenase-like lactoylglutathione lyase family enzyme